MSTRGKTQNPLIACSYLEELLSRWLLYSPRFEKEKPYWLMPLVVADGAALSPNSASSSTSEQLTSRMVYQYYSQRLTSEQHVFMQRAVNECYLRTKPETRPIVDPNHLIYQFSRKFRCYCYPFFPASMKIAPPSCTTLPSAWQRHYFCFVCFHMCTF